MKIPKKLKVGAHEFEVRKVKTRDLTKGNDNWGKTGFSTLQILLDQELKQTRQEETLLHEILHVCFFQGGLCHKYKDPAEEEYIVDTIANQLYPILKNNGLLK